MKKIFILLFSLGSITTLFAQGHRQNNPYPDRNNSRDVVLGQSNSRNVYSNGNRYDTYSFSIRERDAQIRQINRDFDYRIQEVKRSRYLRAGERKRQIRELERQRAISIGQVNDRFSDRRNSHYDNRYGNSNRSRY